MADSMEVDTDVRYLGFLVPALIALIAGLMIHSFIIGVNVTDWWKGRSVTPVDHIVTSLGVSRMCAQCAITLFVIQNILFLSILDSPITLAIIGVIYAFFSYANIWLTSLLSIVLYLKISNFHTRLFLYLRGMIGHRTVYFIVGSVLISGSTCLLSYVISTTDVTKSTTYNTTLHSRSMDCTSSSYTFSFIFGNIFPFLFHSISSVLLFTSLYHHTAKMKMSSNLSINLETYYSVMKLVSATFTYNTVYLIAHLIHHLYYNFYCEKLLCLFIVFEFLPVLHSSYLIYRTAKLRSQMSKVLQNVTHLLFQWKDTETRENIELVSL